MRTTGRRTLAGIAAGALAFAGLAFVATPSAQAAQTTAVWCNVAGGGGSAGVAGDPTSVVPNCNVQAGAGAAATFAASALPVPAGNVFMSMTVTGQGQFSLDPAYVGTALSLITVGGVNVGVAGATADLLGNTGGTPNVRLSVPGQGSATVSITSGINGLVANQVDRGTLTVTGIGATAQAITSQAYYAVDAATLANANAMPLALVHVVDSTGQVVNLTAAAISGITSNPASGTLAPRLYAANDCAADGTLATVGAAFGDTGGINATGAITPACRTTLGAGVGATPNSGVWLTWDGIGGAAPGSYAASFTVTVGANSYPITVNYVVSSTKAADWSIALDQETYELGEVATATMCAKDLGGRIVPDGIAWVSLTGTGAQGDPLTGRNIIAATNSSIFNPTTGLVQAPGGVMLPANNLGTYNGCTAVGDFVVPPTPMEQFRFQVISNNATGVGSEGFVSAATSQTKVATARIGDPAPVTQSIAIVGSRVEGTTQVIVEGTSVGLVGKTVTPYFRFPGETGFTAGTGTRTVDAEGNFNWQRKTGKKIAVQFRGDGVVSNTVIIDAK